MHAPLTRFRFALLAFLTALIVALALPVALPTQANPSGVPTLDRAAGDTVVAWGDNSFGQTSVPSGLTDVVQVAAGGQHTLALKSDGTVVAWGDNSSGQTNVPPGLTDVVQIAAGEAFSAALEADGTVTAWGELSFTTERPGTIQIAAGGHHIQIMRMLSSNNTYTIILEGFGDTTYRQIRSVADSNYRHLAAGQFHTLAISSFGSVLAWGSNSAGQADASNIISINPLQLAGGWQHSLALKGDGTVVAWGGSSVQQPPNDLKGVIQIAAGSFHNLALKADGTVAAWGEPGNQPPAGLSGVVQVDAGGKHSVAVVGGQRRVVAWGGSFQVPDPLGTVRQIAAGAGHALALRSDGTVTAWGSNISGQTNVPPIENPRMVAAGWNHSAALLGNGTVVAWGENGQGQSSVPTGLSGVVQIVAGGFHTLALKADGTVAAWGNASATAMPALARVRQVTAGAFHSAALSTSGQIFVWGENSRGQLNLPAINAPVRQIAAGAYHTLALRTDGTVVAWGDNSSGQTSVPADLSGVVHVAAGGNVSLALKSDGTVVAWGDNSSNQRNVPTGLRGVAQLAVGNTFALALTIDRQAPETTITAGPLPLTNSTTAAISFAANDLGGGDVAGFECSLNDAPFVACVSPQSFSSLREGGNTVRVRASDKFGNVEPSPAELSWTIDSTPPPAPTITSPTNGAVLNTNRPTISGSAEPLSTVTISLQDADFTIGTTTADAAGNWSFTPISLENDLFSLTARAADSAGNISPAASGVTFTVDTVQPSLTLAPAPGQANPTNAAPIRLTVSFSEPVFGLTANDIQLGGTAGPSSAVLNAIAPFNGTAFVIEVNGMTGGGMVTVAIPTGAATDAAGNPNSAASVGVAYDTIAPTPTLSTTVGALTNAADIPIVLRFDEPVSGLSVGELAIDNGTASNFSGAGATYSFVVAPLADGPVTIRVPAGAATDAAGNPSVAAELRVTSDRTAPSLTLTPAPDQADPTDAAPIRFVARFAEPVSGLTGAAIQLGGTAGPSSAALSEITPFDGTSFAIEVTGMTSAGAVTATIPTGAAADAAGNLSQGGSAGVTFSPVAPVVTGIVALDPSPTNAAEVRYRVTFSEPVSGVNADDFMLVTTGALSDAAVATVTGAEGEWTVSIATGSGDGSLRLDLSDDDSIIGELGVPLGGVGVGNGSFSASVSYNLDRTAPTVSLSAPPQVQQDTLSADFTVSYADNLALTADSLGTGAVVVSGPGGFSRIAALVTRSPGETDNQYKATYRIDAPAGGWAAGNYTIALVAGQVSDTAGNKASGAQLGDFTVATDDPPIEESPTEKPPRFTIFLPTLMR